MKKVFVSGCYDILHAGHVQFFKDAKALGDYLTVCFASDEVLRLYKNRRASLPEDNKAFVIGALSSVDRVVKSSDAHPIFDFVGHFKKEKPDILAVTEDDKNKEEKRKFCAENGVQFVVLPKRNPVTRVSTSLIIGAIKKETAGKKPVGKRGKKVSRAVGK
jgi:cytidyltransferase-like protein